MRNYSLTKNELSTTVYEMTSEAARGGAIQVSEWHPHGEYMGYMVFPRKAIMPQHRQMVLESIEMALRTRGIAFQREAWDTDYPVIVIPADA